MTEAEYKKRLKELKEAGMLEAAQALREWYQFWHGKTA